MSTTRDPDRLLRAWLDLMPDEAPDRAIAAVLQATEAAPQVRRPLGSAVGRYSMNRAFLAAAAAIVVVAVGAAILFKPALTVGPSAPPSAAPATTHASIAPSTAGVAADLLGDWLGGHHDVGQLGADVGTHLKILPTGFVITPPNNQSVPLLSAAAETTTDGTIRLNGQGAGASGGCAADAVGVYSTTFSASKQTLTITAASDACAARSNAIAGTWWRADCKSGACYGDIDPGTYGTEYFRPGLQSPSDWAPVYGALQFTTTTPWSEAVDGPTQVVLAPASEYAKWTADGGPADATDILVFEQPGVIKDPATCPDPPVIDESKGRTSGDLLAYLRANPDLTVNSGPAITVDGHPGRVVDLRLRASATVSCFGSGPGEEFLVSTFPQDFNWYTVGLTANQRVRLILLDLGPDSVVGIAIEATASNWEAMLNEATPIVESFHFK